MDMQKRIAQYRRRAREAREEADRMTSAAARQGLIRIADDWDKLAEDIAREHSDAPTAL